MGALWQLLQAFEWPPFATGNGSVWITQSNIVSCFHFASRNLKYLILQVRVWRTGESEKNVDSHCPARILGLCLFCTFSKKEMRCLTFTLALVSFCQDCRLFFKSMHWQMHPIRAYWSPCYWVLCGISEHCLNFDTTPCGTSLTGKVPHVSWINILYWCSFSSVFPSPCHSLRHFATPSLWSGQRWQLPREQTQTSIQAPCFTRSAASM